jgi:hypothetical protein
VSSGMLRRVGLVRTDVSEERSASKLSTRRGFGLDTGFIRSRDLQLHTLQLLTADTTTHN